MTPGSDRPTEESRANVEAARDILATLAAARASLLQLAAAHLPFPRIAALHRAAASDVELLGLIDGMIDRRVRLGGGRSPAAPVFVAPLPPPVSAPLALSVPVAEPVSTEAEEKRTRRRRPLPPAEEPSPTVAPALQSEGIVRASVTMPPALPEPVVEAAPLEARRSITIPPSFPELPTEEVAIEDVRNVLGGLGSASAPLPGMAEAASTPVAPTLSPEPPPGAVASPVPVPSSETVVSPESVASPEPEVAPLRERPRLSLPTGLPTPPEPIIATAPLLPPADDMGAISLEQLLSGPVRIVPDIHEPVASADPIVSEPFGNTGEMTNIEFKAGSAGSSGSFAIYGGGHQESLDSGTADFAIEAGSGTEEVPIQAPADEDEEAPEPSAHSLADLLGAVPEPAQDATQVVGQRLVVSSELSDWAADSMALGAEPLAAEPTGELPDSALTPLAEPTGNFADLGPPREVEPAAATFADMNEEITAVREVPTLREPRVSGARGAMVDVRAAGQGAAPRVMGDEIEAAEIMGEDEPSTGEGLSVTFERGNVTPRVTRSAPQLTEEPEGEMTEPVDRYLQRVSSPVVEETRVQSALDEAQHQARRGDLAKAIQAYTDALEMRPSLVDAFIGRGRCHLELGDYSSAMSDFARAEDLNPDRPDPHVAMGDLYFARKEYKRAIEFYDQAVEIDGGHAMARCRRGISHYYRKNYRQAYQDLQRALALDPEIPNMRKYVAMAQKKLERGE